ncbi:MAG: hypothetical protein WD851_15100 [Pirellulales bacterium]
MNVSHCIYCGRFFNPSRGEGDHILTSALFGEFSGEIRFRGDCQRCNNKFGVFEQILAQSTPFGYYRSLVNPSRRRRPTSGLRQRGAKGSKAPRYLVRHHDHTELVEPLDDPGTVKPGNVLTIHDEHGNEFYVRYFNGMTADALRAALARCGCKNPHRVYVHCDEHHGASLKRLAAEIFPTFRFEDRPDTESGTHLVPVRTTFEFSIDAFRALAKIGLHYYLVHNRRGYCGSEPEFRELRQFIARGGEPEKFFDRAGPPFAMPFGPTRFGTSTTPGTWCHIFAVHEVDKDIVVSMRFFAGPGSVGEHYQITLGTIQSRIICPAGAWGHVYEYVRDRNGRFTGRKLQATLSRLA